MKPESGSADEPSRRGKFPAVDRETSVLEVSRMMRDAAVTEVLVVERSLGMPFAFGMLTAADIQRRVTAAGLDPAVVTVGDIVWND